MSQPSASSCSNALDLKPLQGAHTAVAARNVAIGDTFELLGEDVAGDGGQHVVVVGERQHAGVEGSRVRQQKAMHEDYQARRLLWRMTNTLPMQDRSPSTRSLVAMTFI